MRIHKFKLDRVQDTTMRIGANARILKVGDQRGVLTVWIADEVDVEADPVTVRFIVRKTGEDVPETDYVDGAVTADTVFVTRYVDTVLFHRLADADLVLHVFVVAPLTVTVQ